MSLLKGIYSERETVKVTDMSVCRIDTDRKEYIQKEMYKKV